MTMQMNPRRNESHRPSWRIVRPGQTLSQAILDEMRIRGQAFQYEAAESIGTSEANLSRWIDPVAPVLPNPASSASQANIRGIMRYLRLQSRTDYVTLWLNSAMASVDRTGPRTRRR